MIPFKMEDKQRAMLGVLSIVFALGFVNRNLLLHLLEWVNGLALGAVGGIIIGIIAA